MLIAALLLAAASPESDIRALAERQQRAWNAGDTAAYFANFAPEAVFVDQARTGDKIVPYGRATLKEARAQTRKFLTKSKSVEAGEVRSVQVAGTTARTLSGLTSTITTNGAVRTVCIDRAQTLQLESGRWRVTTRTDTIFRCARRR